MPAKGDHISASGSDVFLLDVPIRCAHSKTIFQTLRQFAFSKYSWNKVTLHLLISDSVDLQLLLLDAIVHLRLDRYIYNGVIDTGIMANVSLETALGTIDTIIPLHFQIVFGNTCQLTTSDPASQVCRITESQKFGGWKDLG